MDVANPTNPASTTNLTNTNGQVDPNNLADPNDQPLSPRENPPLAPHTKSLTNVERPSGTITEPGPRYYVGETGPKIGEPAIGKPHVDLGEDFELAKLKKGVPSRSN
uniref:Uncharacterized protein n=1 Tax=Cannabis sativa TaxID=3483 RepID=A0A803PIK1_CANSA